MAYGAIDQVGGQAALEAKAGHAERPVLIVAVAIGKRVGRLRDPPRHVALPTVLDLASDAGAAALVEQRAGEVPHQQLRHQVLEHRAAPGHQRRAAVHVGDEASEVKPVVLRDVALGNGDEAGQPRFRRQQIVEGGVESSRTLGVGEAVPDREDAPPAVVQEVEPHGVGERGQPAGERPQRLRRTPAAPPASPSTASSTARHQ